MMMIMVMMAVMAVKVQSRLQAISLGRGTSNDLQIYRYSIA